MAQRSAGMMWSGLFRLAQDSSQTLQSQIRQAVVTAVLDRQIPVNQPLPSCRSLADSLGVARGTVVLAFQDLVDQGFLVAEERRGHFVNPEALTRVPEAANDSERAGTIGPAVDWAARFAMRPSALDNISKPADWQRYPYPFIYGQFDPTHFPTNAWRECSRMALGVREIHGWAADMIDRDDPLLIEQIHARLLPRRGIFCHPSEIIVTLGAQHALYMLATLLAGPGRRIVMEDPGYPDARNIFSACGAAVDTVRVDGKGLVPQEIGGDSDIVFTTPSHQCPTTVSLVLERRLALIDRATRQDMVVIEDDYDSQFLDPDAPLPALKSLDRTGRVIHVGSLSKTLAPGLRVGFVVADAVLIRELRVLRRMMLRHPPANNQRAVALFLSLGHHDALVRKMTEASNRRRDVVKAAVARHFPRVKVAEGAGGTALWLEGPSGFDATALSAAARKGGVLIEPGRIFFADAGGGGAFRMGFSSIARDRIEPGVAKLAEIALDLGLPV